METFVSFSNWNFVLSKLEDYSKNASYCLLFAIDGKIYLRTSDSNLSETFTKIFGASKSLFPWDSAIGKGIFYGDVSLFG